MWVVCGFYSDQCSYAVGAIMVTWKTRKNQSKPKQKCRKKISIHHGYIESRKTLAQKFIFQTGMSECFSWISPCCSRYQPRHWIFSLVRGFSVAFIIYLICICLWRAILICVLFPLCCIPLSVPCFSDILSKWRPNIILATWLTLQMDFPCIPTCLIMTTFLE